MDNIDNINEFKLHKFENKRALEAFIHYLFRGINKSNTYVREQNGKKYIEQNEFSVYLHKCFNMSGYGDRAEKNTTERDNAFGIMKSGRLDVNYPSLEHTAVYVGDLIPSKTKDILDYNYGAIYSVKERYIVVMALPKHIEINENKIPWTVPVYKAAQIEKMKDDCCQFTTVFDVNRKDMNLKYVPKEFILGVVHTNLGYDKGYKKQAESEESFKSRGNEYEMWVNEGHFSFKPLKEQKDFLEDYANNTKMNFSLDFTNKSDYTASVRNMIRKGIVRFEDSQPQFYSGSYLSDFDFD